MNQKYHFAYDMTYKSKPYSKNCNVFFRPTTTPVPTTTPTTSTTEAPKPPPKCPQFSFLSFIGGIIMTVGLAFIGGLVFKFYKARTERNYHTL